LKAEGNPLGQILVDFDEGTRKCWNCCVGCRVTNEKQCGRCFAFCPVFVPSVNWEGFNNLLTRVRWLEALTSHTYYYKQKDFQYFQINKSNFTLQRNYVIYIDVFNLCGYWINQITSDKIPKQALRYRPKGRRNVRRPKRRWRYQLHFEDQWMGNTPKPSGTWWWWWWWWLRQNRTDLSASNYVPHRNFYSLKSTTTE